MTLEELSKEIYSAALEIPFENSDFQNDFFVLKSNYTPGRAYRSLLLRLSAKIQALQEARYNLEKEQIDIEESQFKLEHEADNLSPFEKRRIELELKRHQEKADYLEKLVYDAVHEVQHLYAIFQKFPKYTREQFEKEEKEHFQIKLGRSVAGINGALDSLTVIDNNPDVVGSKELEELEKLLLEPTTNEKDVLQIELK